MLKVIERHYVVVTPIYRKDSTDIEGYRCSCGSEWKIGQKANHAETCGSYLPPKEKPKRKRKRKPPEAKRKKR